MTNDLAALDLSLACWSGYATVGEYRRRYSHGPDAYVRALWEVWNIRNLPRDSTLQQAVCATLDRLTKGRREFYDWITRLGTEATKRANKRRAMGQPSPPRESADQARQYVVDSVAVHEWRALGAMRAYAVDVATLLRMLRAISTAYAQAKAAGVPSVRVLRQEGST